MINDKQQKNIHERLRHVRELRGYSSAKDAAEALGVPYGTYSGHENGGRGIKRSGIALYAEFFGVTAAWLEHGSDDSREIAPPVSEELMEEAIAVAEGAMLAAGLSPSLLNDLNVIMRECVKEELVASSRRSLLESRRNLAKSAVSKFLRKTPS